MGNINDQLALHTRTPHSHSLGPILKSVAQMEKALNGDMVLSCSPATLGSSAATVAAAIAGTASKFTRTVTLYLKDAAGNLHDWFDGALGIAVTEVTAGNGVSAIKDGASTVTFSKGVASVVIEYTGTWAAADTQTLTVTGSTRFGFAITNKTSVDTLVA